MYDWLCKKEFVSDKCVFQKGVWPTNMPCGFSKVYGSRNETISGSRNLPNGTISGSTNSSGAFNTGVSFA